MRLGIIGLPQSGKTTLFNALTRGTQPTGMSAGQMEVHTAVVDVPDPRVDRLSAMFKPKKTIYAKVTYADIAGLDGSASKSGISGTLLNQLTQMDGFIHVVRCFEDDNVPHPSGSVDPVRDLQRHGQRVHAQRPDRGRAQAGTAGRGAQKGRRAGQSRRSSAKSRCSNAFTTRSAEEKPLRDMTISAPKKRKCFPGFGFLSRKPMLVVLNLAEGQTAPEINYAHQHSQMVALQGKLEMDIAQLPPEEASCSWRNTASRSPA